jgi:hypothetical protein
VIRAEVDYDEEVRVLLLWKSARRVPRAVHDPGREALVLMVRHSVQRSFAEELAEDGPDRGGELVG